VCILPLQECTHITDVSMLDRVHSLDLVYCIGITDVSMLGNAHSLDLQECKIFYRV